jgi:predicted kinase
MPYKKYKNTSEPFVELLCGISNSGKSTYIIKRYPNGFNGVILSRDDLVMEYGYGTNYNECWKSLPKEVHKIIDKKLNEKFIFAIQCHSNIIIDMVNLTERVRATWLNNLPKIYTRKIRVFMTPLNIIKKRNYLQGNEKFIPENVLDEMYNRFQLPKTYEYDEIILEHSS